MDRETVKRWDAAGDGVARQEPDGDFVKYTDYLAALAARDAAEAEVAEYSEMLTKERVTHRRQRDELKARAEAAERERDAALACLEAAPTKAELQRTLAEARTAIVHYLREQWSPVANYSDGYWYMEGRPWSPAESVLAAIDKAMQGEG